MSLQSFKWEYRYITENLSLKKALFSVITSNPQKTRLKVDRKFGLYSLKWKWFNNWTVPSGVFILIIVAQRILLNIKLNMSEFNLSCGTHLIADEKWRKPFCFLWSFLSSFKMVASVTFLCQLIISAVVSFWIFFSCFVGKTVICLLRSPPLPVYWGERGLGWQAQFALSRIGL